MPLDTVFPSLICSLPLTLQTAPVPQPATPPKQQGGDNAGSSASQHSRCGRHTPSGHKTRHSSFCSAQQEPTAAITVTSTAPSTTSKAPSDCVVRTHSEKAARRRSSLQAAYAAQRRHCLHPATRLALHIFAAGMVHVVVATAAGASNSAAVRLALGPKPVPSTRCRQQMPPAACRHAAAALDVYGRPQLREASQQGCFQPRLVPFRDPKPGAFLAD